MSTSRCASPLNAGRINAKAAGHLVGGCSDEWCRFLNCMCVASACWAECKKAGTVGGTTSR